MTVGRFLIALGALCWAALAIFHPGWDVSLAWMGAAFVAAGVAFDGVVWPLTRRS